VEQRTWSKGEGNGCENNAGVLGGVTMRFPTAEDSSFGPKYAAVGVEQLFGLEGSRSGEMRPPTILGVTRGFSAMSSGVSSSTSVAPVICLMCLKILQMGVK